MTTNLAQVWSVFAPFIAAGLAAWLTYSLSLRQRRIEILIAERLAAFRSLQEALVGLVHYCETRGSPGDDIGPSLPQGVPASALTQAQHLSHVIDANRIFISAEARRRLVRLCRSVSMAASMELAAISNPKLEDRGIYKGIREDAEMCIECLYGELGLPKEA